MNMLPTAKSISDINIVLKDEDGSVGYLNEARTSGDGTYTNVSEQFMVSEIIREKTLWLLQHEIPHGIAIEILSYKDTDNICQIDADIIIEKQSHKKIVIGDKGDMLKNIGIKARQEIEKLIDKKVMLKLFVKVRDDWRNKSNFVNSLGYDSHDI